MTVKRYWRRQRTAVLTVCPRLLLYLLFLLLLLPVDFNRVYSRPPPPHLLFLPLELHDAVHDGCIREEAFPGHAQGHRKTKVLEKWWHQDTPLSKALLHVEHKIRARAITQPYA